MNALGACVGAELLKIFKSKILLITGLAFVLFTPIMIIGSGFSPSQALYVEGSFCFSILAAWMFGREFVQKTVTELLVFPAARSTIVFAKIIALTISVLMLSIGQFVLSWVLTLVTGMGGWALEPVMHDLARQGILTVMLLALCMPIFFLGICSRGYFMPVAVSIAAILYVNINGSSLPFAIDIPWSIPIVYTMRDDLATIRPLDIVVLVSVGLGSILASLAWWLYADYS
ncbi:MAG: ABC transporter permease [Treponema sp.]|jgi:ABC-2 type transport system permease protein|nr:ABC transporter permease [Treponema sp.]